MHKIKHGLMVAILFVTSQQVLAQEVFIYPSKEQSPELQEQDQFECYNWAKTNTGYDPTNNTPASNASANQHTGGVARGALGGAAIGAIAGDSSQATARGAATGALIGGVRQGRANQQGQAAQVNSSTVHKSDYDRAYAACLEGRGYSVQ
ncbi:hypothetical protein CBP31_05275 [Oceanisphaera profunda]|uniref:YMGG-like Gly-zipper domain-containing protein n=1 Tax=Oceanisphaera profunda TaxID=1416627 RepID=A0A1Y0D3J6_9GAMM|nr:hypothetical protein [Oceanisphaera profunda]ART82108.1 hypothetical protein CBP31_05275 [Oceanisphaera profunda]